MKVKISKLITDERIKQVFACEGKRSLLTLKGRMTGHSTGVVMSVIGDAMTNPTIPQPLFELSNQRTRHLEGIFHHIINTMNFQGFKLVKNRNHIDVVYDIKRVVDTDDYYESTDIRMK